MEQVFSSSQITTMQDGAEWERLSVNNGYAVLTQEGRKLFTNYPNIGQILRGYMRENRSAKASGKYRNFYDKGDNGSIYAIPNHPFVIKEVGMHEPISGTLHRMDLLHHLCASGLLPEHVAVPVHYGAVIMEEDDQQYMLMQKINAVDLERLQQQRRTDDELIRLAELEFLRIRAYVDIAMRKFDPDCARTPLGDWKRRNALIDRTQPHKDVPFTIWMIDQ